MSHCGSFIRSYKSSGIVFYPRRQSSYMYLFSFSSFPVSSLPKYTPNTPTNVTATVVSTRPPPLRGTAMRLPTTKSSHLPSPPCRLPTAGPGPPGGFSSPRRKPMMTMSSTALPTSSRTVIWWYVIYVRPYLMFSLLYIVLAD